MEETRDVLVVQGGRAEVGPLQAAIGGAVYFFAVFAIGVGDPKEVFVFGTYGDMCPARVSGREVG